MTAKLNFGLRLPAVHPTDVGRVRDFIVEAERLGFHSLWAGDHVFYNVDVLQPLQLLSWAAALTTRMRLGTAVMLTAYLNPVLLAKAAATLDCLSGGRLTLGVSIGGTEAEFKSIGVPMDQRVGRLIESVAIMRKLWQEDDVSYDGRYYEVEHGTINPKPAQRPGVPVYFGATSDAMLRRLARVADGWVGSAAVSPEAYLAGVDKVKEFAAATGRDANALGFAKLQNVSIDADRNKAVETAERHWKSYYGPRYNIENAVIYGTAEECLARLQVFTQADAPEVTLALEPAGLDLGQLDLLARTVAQVAAG